MRQPEEPWSPYPIGVVERDTIAQVVVACEAAERLGRTCWGGGFAVAVASPRYSDFRAYSAEELVAMPRERFDDLRYAVDLLFKPHR